MIKVFIDVWVIADEMSSFHLLLPVVPRPGDFINVPYNSLPADWVERVRKDCRIKAEKQAWEKFAYSLKHEGPLFPLKFEVLDSAPEWRMDHSSGAYVVDINVWPDVWSHNANH